jgi:hypothetical protein
MKGTFSRTMCALDFCGYSNDTLRAPFFLFFLIFRSAILAWLFRLDKNTCPLTRRPLTASKLKDNTDLKEEIRVWKRANRSYNIKEDRSDDSFDSEDEDEEWDADKHPISPNDSSSKPLNPSRLVGIRKRMLEKREKRIADYFCRHPAPVIRDNSLKS